MNVNDIRGMFPALSQKIYKDRPLIYFDNAATTQKPQAVIDRLSESLALDNANIHRGVHYLSRKATEAHEEARAYVADFINAREPAEVLFTRGTTESINLVASSFCPAFMEKDDEVLVTDMEHHSNIVPWQLQGVTVRHAPISEEGVLDVEEMKRMMGERTKLVSICYASNVLGTVNPVKEITAYAHALGIPVLVDAAQAVAHRPVDVQDIGCDFLAFSGHKVYGPTGIGVLYGKREWLEKIPPYQGGGEMIERVSFDRTTYGEIPYKFEAGTPDFIGSVGLMEALKFVRGIGFDFIMSHEKELLETATELMTRVPGLRIYGTAPHKEAVISFLVDGIHPYDLGTLMDQMGVALRTGHHCAQPLMDRYGITGTARASFAVYNTVEEVYAMVEILDKALAMLR